MPLLLAGTRNGVDTRKLDGELEAIRPDPSLGTFRFRARNHWIDAAHNRSTIQGARREDRSRGHAFSVDAGEPAVWLGLDTGPNPPEFRLHTLAACLTASLVYVAAARDVRLTAVETVLEGDMDVRGTLGLAGDVRNGFSRIRLSVKVAGDAPEDELRELVERARARSSVFDVVTNGVPVEIDGEFRPA